MQKKKKKKEKETVAQLVRALAYSAEGPRSKSAQSQKYHSPERIREVSFMENITF